MFKKSKNIISVIYTFLKFCFIKLCRWKEFHFSGIERFSPATSINLHKGGSLCLGTKVRAHTGVRLACTPRGSLSIGNNTALNYNCMITAKYKITIGNDCTFGPNVLVYDHDHDFRNTATMNSSKFTVKEVIIGNNVWIGAGTIILKGSVIGDNCVIAAGSVIRGTVESNSVAYNPKEVVVKKYK